MATAVEAGRHICLEVSRFRDLVAAGVFKRKPNGRYNLDEIREAYCLHMQKVAAGRAADGGEALSAQRARLAKAQSERAEFANAIARGDYVSLSLMKQKLIATFSVFREKSLTLPGKVADALTPHCAEDRNTITEILRDECYELLEDLAVGKVLPPGRKSAAPDDANGGGTAA